MSIVVWSVVMDADTVFENLIMVMAVESSLTQ